MVVDSGYGERNYNSRERYCQHQRYSTYEVQYRENMVTRGDHDFGGGWDRVYWFPRCWMPGCCGLTGSMSDCSYGSIFISMGFAPKSIFDSEMA
jgi:hypothetical protein